MTIIIPMNLAQQAGRVSARLAAPAALVVLLAACQSTPAPAPQTPPPPQPTPVAPRVAPQAPGPQATPGLQPRERLRRALELLDQGNAPQARAEVVALLQQQPDNAIGKKLLDQIDVDPRSLLGAQSFPYVIRSGETLSEIADAFLGDKTLFWALARYNNIAVPATAEVGQTIQIPGAQRAARRRAAAPDDAAAAPKKPAKPAAPAASTRNPARAQQLRGSALEQLNRGAVAQAVSLLEQALTFDPGNSLIMRDLDRARRLLGAH